MAFNTRNPVEPNGSTDPGDLKDNAAIIDKLVNSSDLTWLGRLGKTLKTWAGMQQDFNQLLINTGYESNHLTYTVGSALTVDRSTQLIDYNGFTYRVKLPSTFPVVLTGVWATDSTRLVDVGDASVRSDLVNPTRGATLIAWLQNGTGAVSRLVSEKLKDVVSLYDYAGSDDGVTDNVGPFNNAKNYLGVSKVLRWVRRGAGSVKFNSNFDLNNVIIHPDPGMTVVAAESTLNISATSPAKIIGNRLDLYMADANFKYQLYPEHSEDLAEKRSWLDTSAADLNYLEALDLTSLRYESLSWPDGDTWNAAGNYAIGSNGPDWPYVNWNSGVSSTWYRNTVGVRQGDELSVSFSTGGVFNRAAFIQHATGYIVLYATGINGDLNYAQKIAGQPVATNNVGVGDVFRSQIQYYGENSEWRIRVLSRRQFVILLNGVQVAGILNAPSDILRAGFGYMPGFGTGAVVAAALSGFVRKRNSSRSGIPVQAITIHGDSMSADIHGGWAYTMRKALDGMGGIVVESVTNLAVPGHNSAEVLARVKSVGFNGGTTIFMVGTNDIQGMIPVQDYLANMRAMFTLARNAGQLVIAMTPMLWYTQAEAEAAGAAPGTGQASGNAKGGADYRTLLARLCASMDIKLVDLPQLTGPINAKYLVPGPGVIADTGVRDNIHETAYMNKKVGVAAAKAVYGAASGMTQRQAEVEALPIVFSSGWSAYSSAPEAPQMFRECRVLTLLGKAFGPTTGGTLTGAQVGQLREDLWPAVPYSSPISYSGGNCKVYISLTGIITVDNYVAAAGSYLDFSVLQRIILRN